MFEFNFVPFPAVPEISSGFYSSISNEAQRQQRLKVLREIESALSTMISNTEAFLQELYDLPDSANLPNNLTVTSLLNRDKQENDTFVVEPGDVFLCLEEVGNPINFSSYIQLMFLEFMQQQRAMHEGNKPLLDLIKRLNHRIEHCGFAAYVIALDLDNAESLEAEISGYRADIIAWCPPDEDWKKRLQTDRRKPKQLAAYYMSVNRTNEYRLKFIQSLIMRTAIYEI